MHVQKVKKKTINSAGNKDNDLSTPTKNENQIFPDQRNFQVELCQAPAVPLQKTPPTRFMTPKDAEYRMPTNMSIHPTNHTDPQNACSKYHEHDIKSIKLDVLTRSLQNLPPLELEENSDSALSDCGLRTASCRQLGRLRGCT